MISTVQGILPVPVQAAVLAMSTPVSNVNARPTTAAAVISAEIEWLVAGN